MNPLDALGEPIRNLEAEEAVVGAMVIDNGCIAAVAVALQPTHFWHPDNATLFREIVAMWREGGAVDWLLLSERLAAKGMLAKLGGAPKIVALRDATMTAANVMHYATIVKSLAIYRTIRDAARSLAIEAQERSEPPADMAQKALTTISKVLAGTMSRRDIELNDVITQCLDAINERKSQGSASGIQTGFYDLDFIIGGLTGGRLYILAARPSVGKSALAVNIADRVGRNHDGKVLFFSLEMSRGEIGERLISANSLVDSSHLQNGSWSIDEGRQIVEACGTLSSVNLAIDDTPAASVLYVATIARQRALAGKLSLIVVDYLQLMAPDDRRVPRHEQVSGITRDLKALAGELDVPILALSQLNRAVEQRDGRPRLSDLRESGSIEQDAHVVMFLHRPDPRERSQIELIVAKNRNGKVGLVDLIFLQPITHFESAARQMQTFESMNESEF